MDIPGSPPPVLIDALGRHDADIQVALIKHLLGGTSAEYLSDWLRRAGTPVSATTIKKYRRSLDG